MPDISSATPRPGALVTRSLSRFRGPIALIALAAVLQALHIELQYVAAAFLAGISLGQPAKIQREIKHALENDENHRTVRERFASMGDRVAAAMDWDLRS